MVEFDSLGKRKTLQEGIGLQSAGKDQKTNRPPNRKTLLQTAGRYI